MKLLINYTRSEIIGALVTLLAAVICVVALTVGPEASRIFWLPVEFVIGQSVGAQ
ncbi:MAG: hypothetical protein KDD70_14865 [Bdellovibrionales bacterium]|nr:hypothetical protein [Bdellovibrionales bacterium]